VSKEIELSEIFKSLHQVPDQPSTFLLVIFSQILQKKLLI